MDLYHFFSGVMLNLIGVLSLSFRPMSAPSGSWNSRRGLQSGLLDEPLTNARPGAEEGPLSAISARSSRPWRAQLITLQNNYCRRQSSGSLKQVRLALDKTLKPSGVAKELWRVSVISGSKKKAVEVVPTTSMPPFSRTGSRGPPLSRSLHIFIHAVAI